MTDPVNRSDAETPQILLRPMLRLGRWAILLALAAVLFFGHHHLDNPEVRSALGWTLLAYALVSVVLLRRPDLSARRVVVIVVADFVFTALLVEASGGVHSPFFGLYDLVVVAAAIFYGLRGGLLAATAVIAVTLIGGVTGYHRTGAPEVETLMATVPELFLSGVVAGYLTAQLKREAERRRESERSALLLDLERQSREREMALAREVQQAALPPPPTAVPGLEVAVRFRAAAEVGGDFYDFYQEGSVLGLLIGDATGKGVPAALVATTAMHFFHTQAPRLGLAHWCELFNRELEERLPESMMATAACCWIDGATGRGAWVHAGHPLPVLCRPGRAPVLLEEGGLALGIEKSVRYCEVELALEEGDVLLFYTDGLTEAAPPDGSLVDLEPFLELLPCLLPRSAAEIAAGIEARLLEIAVPRDDLTLIVLKKIPGGEDSL